MDRKNAARRIAELEQQLADMTGIADEQAKIIKEWGERGAWECDSLRARCGDVGGMTETMNERFTEGDGVFRAWDLARRVSAWLLADAAAGAVPAAGEGGK